MDSVDIAVYLVVEYFERSVSILSYFFSSFFLACRLFKSGLYITTYFGYGQYFI